MVSGLLSTLSRSLRRNIVMERASLFVSKQLAKQLLVLYIIVPFFILLLPPDIFLGGGEGMCLSRRFFDMECFGCGMTRACVALRNADFESAYQFNWRVVVVVPLLVAEYLRQLLRQYKLYRLYFFGFYAGHK